MSTTGELFDRVVAASGLAEIIAPFTVRRLLVRAGLTDTELTPQTLADALPHFEDGLGVYLKGGELEAAMDRLRALAA